MRICMPSTSGGSYHSHKMNRITGEGIRGAILANASKPRLLGDERNLGKSGMKGKGGSFLLDGGLGGQSSYPSVAQYTATTGRVIKEGRGLEKISSKLSNLSLKPKKHNIKFEM